jgi:ABC-type Fe3+-hydroxamate transport system substrate-binding protein
VVTDDEGSRIALASPVDTVISLVPSLTETVEVTAPGLVVAATDWCTHPAGLDVDRIRGPKNPDVDRIVALAPDLVIASAEENKPADLDLLRRAGLAVYVTDIRSLDGAFASLARLLTACGLAGPGWLDDAEARWSRLRPGRPRRRAVIPVWRRPWMAIGSDTFAGSLLRRLGVDNVLSQSPERYPCLDVTALPPHDLVVLPDEPYPFTADDGPESFPDAPAVLVPGRLITWYGPSLVEAARTLPTILETVPAPRRRSCRPA